MFIDYRGIIGVRWMVLLHDPICSVRHCVRTAHSEQQHLTAKPHDHRRSFHFRSFATPRSTCLLVNTLKAPHKSHSSAGLIDRIPKKKNPSIAGKRRNAATAAVRIAAAGSAANRTRTTRRRRTKTKAMTKRARPARRHSRAAPKNR